MRHHRNVFSLWEALDRIQTVILEQWYHLSTGEKALLLLLSLPVLFYFARSSDSNVLIAISGLLALMIAAYLVIYMMGHG